jgi:hypothetical protein
MSLLNKAFSVTYSAANDAFEFAFVDPDVGTLAVNRVGFTYVLNVAAADAVTFHSRPSTAYVQFDGLTVSAASCTAPVQAVPLDLYNAILALYTGGGGGVTSVNGDTGPVVVIGADDLTTGTLDAARLPALSATGDATGTGTAGTGSIPLTLATVNGNVGTFTYATLTTNAKGLVLAAASGAPPVTSVNGQTGAAVIEADDITAGTLDTARLPALSATGDAAGTGVAGTGSIPLTLATVPGIAGIYTNPSSIEFNSKGLAIAATSGGGSNRSYLQAHTSVYVSPGVLSTGVGYQLPLNDPPYGLILTGNMSGDFTPVTGTYTMTYTGTSGTFLIQFCHDFIYDVTGHGSYTQMQLYISINNGGVAGGAIIHYIQPTTVPSRTYTGCCTAITTLSPGQDLEIRYIYNPDGATSGQIIFLQNTMIIDRLA